MKCVLGITRDFMNFPHNSRLYTSFTYGQSSNFGLKKWVFTTVFKENPRWGFEDRKSARRHRFSHAMTCLKKWNKPPMDYSSVYSTSKPGDKDQVIDYLGVCIWDDGRLSWVASSSGFHVKNSQIRAWTLAQYRAWIRSRAI